MSTSDDKSDDKPPSLTNLFEYTFASHNYLFIFNAYE